MVGRYRTWTVDLRWLAVFVALGGITCGQLNSIGGAISPSASQSRREEQAVRNAKSKEVLKYMNLSIDPCDDFYEFACGSWINYHTPAKCEVITPQSQLELRVNKDLQILLDEPNTSQDNLSVGKVKDFYKSCLRVESRSSEQKAFFVNFVKKHGGLPMVPHTTEPSWQLQYNWAQVLATLRSNYGMNILIGLEIGPNLQNAHYGSKIYLTEPEETLLPIDQCSAETMSRANIREEPYEQIQKEVSENLQNWFSIRSNEANRVAGDIVSFEFNLCKQMRKDQLIEEHENQEPVAMPSMSNTKRGLPYRTGQDRLNNNNRFSPYLRGTPQQLTQMVGDQIPFKEYLDMTLNSVINDPVYMRSKTYFDHLNRILRTTSKPTLANYIMYRALHILHVPADGHRNSRRAKYCAELATHYFPKIIGDMYIRKHYRAATKTDVEMVYNMIAKAFVDSLKVEWMDENTRRAARQKLADFKMQFPIHHDLDLSELHIERWPDYWNKLENVMNYNARQQLNALYYNNYDGQASETIEGFNVGARLQPYNNSLNIGWGLLQPPYYHPLYPYSMKFALLGQRLAREMAFGFDEKGWKRHPLSPMQWDDYTAEGFHNRSQCFRIQYSNYLHNNPDVFRNASKLREIIADSNGLSVAFRAYLMWLDSIDPSERMILLRETLSDLNFTNTQLFFINFAQTRCATVYTEQQTVEFLPMDKHTSVRYNVNGPLSNFIEFARDFNCAPGTEMNPDDKCVVY